MTIVVSALWLSENGVQGGFLVATNVGSIGAPDAARAEGAWPGGRDPIFDLDAPLASWQGVVIHHLGQPAGDADRVHRLHLSYGYAGLGYHFLVGNGNGLGDGFIHVGYRWEQQLPGAHVAQVVPGARELNEQTIGICLIGNGDARPFTRRQMSSLTDLLHRLQGELGLPARAIRLHRDLSPEISSPGRYFPVAELEEQLRP